MTAVAPVVVDCGGQWVGWAGDCSLSAIDEIPEASEEDTTPTAGLLKHQVINHTRTKKRPEIFELPH